MLPVILADFHHNPILRFIIHLPDEIIVEIEGPFLQAHGTDAVKQHFLCLFDIPSVDMI